MPNRYGFSTSKVGADGVTTTDILTQAARPGVQSSAVAERIAIREYLKKQAAADCVGPEVSSWLEAVIESLNTEIGKLSN